MRALRFNDLHFDLSMNKGWIVFRCDCLVEQVLLLHKDEFISNSVFCWQKYTEILFQLHFFLQLLFCKLPFVKVDLENAWIFSQFFEDKKLHIFSELFVYRWMRLIFSNTDKLFKKMLCFWKYKWDMFTDNFS